MGLGGAGVAYKDDGLRFGDVIALASSWICWAETLGLSANRNSSSVFMRGTGFADAPLDTWVVIHSSPRRSWRDLLA